MRCTNCHAQPPHENDRLDQHTLRLDCTVCHIPYFAKIASTDIFRDYRAVEVYEVKQLYEPAIQRQSQVVPVYRFWNGLSTFYQFGTRAVLGDNGRLLMADPLGDILDPDAKIFPFKYHQAMQPHDPVSGRLLPLKMGILFQRGDVEAAVLAGVNELGWELPQGYDFLPTERYMGIFHEVSPAEQALECKDCHSEKSRMDFELLGYAPNENRAGKPLCASCHEDESDEWPEDYFFKVHNKHVDDKNIACQECHIFPTAN